MKHFNTPCHQRSERFWLRESLSKPTETLTKSKEETGRAPHRPHDAAKRDSPLTFNNLLHHLSSGEENMHEVKSTSYDTPMIL